MPHARCSRCEARRTLARKPHEYIRPPRCRRCGANRYRLDVYRQTGRTGCTGYHFPHRRGSKFCIFNKKLTAQDIAEREGFALAECPF